MKKEELSLVRSFGLACVFLLSIFTSQAASINDTIDDVFASFKSGNAKEIAKHFSSTVSLTLLKDDGTYSKVQAEIILREFFAKNTPTDAKLIHRLDANPNFRYIVLSLETQKGTYRVSYKLSDENKAFKITELRIELIQ